MVSKLIAKLFRQKDTGQHMLKLKAFSANLRGRFTASFKQTVKSYTSQGLSSSQCHYNDIHHYAWN